jgi:hypothetical protein
LGGQVEFVVEVGGSGILQLVGSLAPEFVVRACDRGNAETVKGELSEGRIISLPGG